MQDATQGPKDASLEALLQSYRRDPKSVDAAWHPLFAQMTQEGVGKGTAPGGGGNLFRSTSLTAAAPAGTAQGQPVGTGEGESLKKQERVDALIRAYRSRGHRIAQIDPLGRRPTSHPELELGHHGLSDADLDTQFSARSIGGTTMSLRDIVAHLRATYCRTIGVQFMHIDDGEIRHWLQQRMEAEQNHATLSREQQLQILTKLTDAEVFEQFVHRKFLGARRFSLEGGETLLPLLETAIDEGAEHGVREVVIGMAHRGRLNVLVNTVGKPARKMFMEFADEDPYLKPGRGDVKYHLGYSGDRTTRKGHKVHLSLCFNPSHLGFVAPVAAGRVRAKQARRQDAAREQVLCLCIHGDAAFAGQGTTQELLNMSQLPGYDVGGTVHVLVNNQVGFTTPPELGRSTPYATDVARMLEVPIFHVNGEDPESVTQVVRLAMAFRAKFHRDVIIDMYCYRRLGHNESDEPAFTQPVMSQWIAKQPSVRAEYVQNLIKLGGVTEAEAEQIAQRSTARLEEGLQEAKQAKDGKKESGHEHAGYWAPYVGERAKADYTTAVARETLEDLLTRAAQVPSDFTPHPKLVKLLEQRREMARGERPLDWGGGEALAFATLLSEGAPLRLSGQDCGRGTFSHRHAVLHDVGDGHRYIPLAHLGEDQGKVEIWDSPLSESAVLGFDYGVSLDTPEGLTLWEAQFGDFANGAQVIIDQFIASGEAKWQRNSGITLLLPHGFEGAGSEHSSARLERFLTLAAEDNLQVCYPTTPAQMFHLLRRQVRRAVRKPLVVLTPKSLLRHPMATSTLDELSSGGFAPVLDEVDAKVKKAAERVLVCSGKVYYDLLAARQAQKGGKPCAIVRLEQLYPALEDHLVPVLAGYKKVREFVWVQEEPLNQGAWPYLRLLGDKLGGSHALQVVAREAAAAPACGSASRHKLEQEDLIKRALGG